MRGKQMNCLACGSSRTKTKWNLDKDHTIGVCLHCGVSFLYPQPGEDELRQLYSEQYYHAWGLQDGEENEVTRRMKRATFRLRLDLIQGFEDKGGNKAGSDAGNKSGSRGVVLDVGCATGYFLEEAQEAGYDPYGVEFSSFSAAIAKRKFGDDRVFEGILEGCGWPDGSFDLITMSDLIEHVRDPAETLGKAAALLKEDGLIMIMTPDTRSLSARLMGRRWTHYKPEHFFCFNRRSMEGLAARCGLRMIHFERSRKALNLDYLHTQFSTYRHPMLTPAVGAVHAILPKRWNARNFYFSIGEMVVLLRKTADHPSV
jgi:SAM-dependent methyltransferase